MYTKDSVWKYEKEYRIVTRNHKDIENDMFDSYKNQKGSLHKTQEFNLSLSKVYLGMNCTEEKSMFGDSYIDSIAKEIQEEFPGIKGFNRRGLYRMKQFYETYAENDVVTPLVTQISYGL